MAGAIELLGVMRRAIRTSVELFSETFEQSGRVVELGAYRMPGYEKLCDLRPSFHPRAYIGCDIRMGLGVDQIEDAHNLSFETSSVGTMLMFEILEHLPSPNKAVSEAFRVLADDGLLAVSVPFTYRLHGFPSDYWRFTASGVHQLLSDFPDKVVFSLGPRLKPAFTFAVASKSSSPEFTEQKRIFQKRIQAAFEDTRMQGYISVLKERGRDFFGHLLGRSELSAKFFDATADGGYIKKSL